MAAPTVIDMKKREAGDGPSRYHVVVLGRDGAVPRALPAAGEVLIGRDEDADVRIIDPRASRQHARIVVGDTIEVEDLGSANGTRLHDQALEPGKRVPLQSGDVILIGSTMLVLHRGEPELDARRIWAHGHLETRLIEECARGQSRGAQLALVRIHIQGQEAPILVERIITDRLRDGDLFSAYAPNEYEVLLLDSGEAGARALADGIVAALAVRKIAANHGIAFCPADGTSPQALLGLAATQLGVPIGSLTASSGVVSGGGKSVAYGDLIGGKLFNVTMPLSTASSFALIIRASARHFCRQAWSQRLRASSGFRVKVTLPCL